MKGPMKLQILASMIFVLGAIAGVWTFLLYNYLKQETITPMPSGLFAIIGIMTAVVLAALIATRLMSNSKQ